MAEWAARRAEPGDIPAIVQFLERCFESPKTEDLFRWKHLNNPFGESPCLLAEADGSVVCLRAFLRWVWLAGGRQVPAVRAVDTATDPAWRRRGLFSELTRQLVEEVRRDGTAFVFNTPGASSRPGYLKLGWQEVGRLPLLVRPLRSLASSWMPGRAGGRARPSDLTALPEVRHLLAEERLEGLLAEVERSGSTGRYQTLRSKAFLKWRYAEVPGYDYRALWQLGAGGSAALVCHGRLRRGLREIKISELLVGEAEGDLERGSALLTSLAASSDADYLVACLAPGVRERQAFRRAGFLPARAFAPWLTARALEVAEDLPDPREIGSWNLSLGDIEVF